MEYVLQTKNLTKKYKKYQALVDLNMNIPKGSIYGFVGKNGAGKTTLIRLICGLQEPTSGKYTLCGIDNGEKEIVKARQNMGAVVETPSVYLEMTAEENLKHQCMVRGISSFGCIKELLRIVGLEGAKKKKVKNYSLGMKQRLGIAIALVGEPEFLILDEPTNGLDPQGIVDIRELILKLNHEKKITILISSHMLGELSKLATHYGIIDKGRMIKEFSVADLEAISQKGIRLKVTNAKVLAHVLDLKKLRYTIVSDTTVDVFGSFNITQFVAALAKENCEILAIQEKEVSLENYYISLVGGE